MLKQLGSIPFSQEYLAETSVGRWVIENDPGKEPRMYVDDVMLGLIGLKEQTNPEDTFKAWLAGIDENYMDSVMETEQMNLAGIRAEVQYPWHYPDGRTIMIRCEGIRNFAYEGGVRTEGRHRNITDLAHLQKESVVIDALTADFECVNYIILNDDKYADVAIPFRTSERLKALVPGWEKETSFHNRLQMLLDNVGFRDDLQHFYVQTRRETVLKHLQREPAYYVNARAQVEDGKVEYFQLKFIADRDDDGKIIGIVVGIHNVDDEMRTELQLREKVEQLVNERTEELKQKTDSLARVNEQIISMVGDIVEWRDSESGDHINRVRYLTNILGMQVMKDLPEYNLSVEDVLAISAMSPLHDVGKIRIPDSILLKPGKLTAEEFEIMKTHCEKGCEVLESISSGWDRDLVNLSLEICRCHHEKWDGKGYPQGLKGDSIPISAQIVSIADAYDALVNKRYYKNALPHDKAFNMIMNGECGAFSYKLLSCLAKCKTAFAENTEHINEYLNVSDSADLQAISTGLYISEAIPLVEEISESMPGGFFIYQADEEEKLIYFNDIMVDIFGCSSREEFSEYINNSFKGIVHPDDYNDVESNIFSQIKDNKDSLDHVVYRIIKKDGSIRWIDDYGRYVKSDDMGNVFFVFVVDFTETYQHRSAGVIEAGKAGMPAAPRKVLQDMKVLVVDDMDLARDMHKEMLEDEGATVVEADNGLKAVEIVKEQMDFDLILMDLVMPVMSGVSATQEIRKLIDAAGKHTTIICLTAEGSDMQVKEALEAGAYECMYKPLNIPELSKHVISSIRETTMKMERQLADTLKIANTDALTKVKSIAAYTDKISELSKRMSEDETLEFGIVVCDCDNLKLINDSFGHDVGDQYICNTSSAICNVFSHSPVYRIGGDEFVVILEGHDYQSLTALKEELRKRTVDFRDNISPISTSPFNPETLSMIQRGSSSFSFGIAIFDPIIDDTVGSVIKRADLEMYKFKRI